MKRTRVIDANFAIKAALPGPLQTPLRAALTQWHRDGDATYAPSLWRYETTSTLTKLIHLKALSEAEALRALNLIAVLEVELILPDSNQVQKAFDWTLRLHRAAAYDSFYLALAETTSNGLWTADERLYNATKSLVPWVHWAGDAGLEGAPP
jgi:predicted nucleic acid-binding protein